MPLSAANTAPAPAADGLRVYANAIRVLAMDAVEKAQSGHPGMPMGMADVATVLFTKFMKFDASNPTWPDRDRFILSAGHGSMLLYSLGYLLGYEKMTLDQLKQFRQIGSLTPGHPERMPEAGIEMTTGPLGQGIAHAVGFALAERIQNARFGSDLVDHYTYVIASDGDMEEGISHEAASLAGHLNLGRMIVLYDDNGISIDGPTSMSFTDDTSKRFEAYGWDVQSVDGHDMAQIEAAIAKAKTTKTPSLICCKTRIGYGAPTKENSHSSHGSPLGAEEILGARKNYLWDHDAFQIPDEVLSFWRNIGTQGSEARKAWEKRLADMTAPVRDAFETAQSGNTYDRAAPVIAALVDNLVSNPEKLATRQASGKTLDVLVSALPELVGGSADLSPSNNTYKKGTAIVKRDSFAGQYIHYGVREHGMAAAMNGMNLHGGIVGYGGTFLTFADYNRPAIRLAALMKNQVIHVMTHDSIGLGEDGPTHQPVEHLSALRAIPNTYVFRPGDAVETAECWLAMLKITDAPSIIALSRQAVPLLRDKRVDNPCLKGAYILKKNVDQGDVDIVLMASGTEVSIAHEAYEKLSTAGKKVQLVSVPCMELFNQQDKAYRREVLGPQSARRIAVEAAIRQSWDRYLNEDDVFIGMSGFGESGPYQKLYEHFGITADHIVRSV